MDSKIYLIVLVAVTLLTACIPEKDYYLSIKNDTDDTLSFFFNADTNSTTNIVPSESIDFYQFVGDPKYVDKKDYHLKNAIDYDFRSIDICKNDSCVIHWSGRAEYKGASEHDFYNLDSWKTIEGNSANKYQFSIMETDY